MWCFAINQNPCRVSGGKKFQENNIFFLIFSLSREAWRGRSLAALPEGTAGIGVVTSLVGTETEQWLWLKLVEDQELQGQPNVCKMLSDLTYLHRAWATWVHQPSKDGDGVTSLPSWGIGFSSYLFWITHLYFWKITVINGKVMAIAEWVIHGWKQNYLGILCWRKQISSTSRICFMAVVTSHGKQCLALKAHMQCFAKQFSNCKC